MAVVVTLAQIKADKALREMAFVKQTRLSVSPLTKAQFERLMELAK
jgi:predicted RNA-binding protein with PUA-like domain